MNPSNAPVAMFAKRSLQLILVLGAAVSFIEVMLVLTAAQLPHTSTQDRKLKKKEFVDMPVRVREVKDLQSETWPNDWRSRLRMSRVSLFTS
ncbi:MAG TPA: hypothetical protein VFD63_01380 [Pyrinomonadaceae bacterium]|nr:hypothetical protein [Pyrinomonadaceae bacterium]